MSCRCTNLYRQAASIPNAFDTSSFATATAAVLDGRYRLVVSDVHLASLDPALPQTRGAGFLDEDEPAETEEPGENWAWQGSLGFPPFSLLISGPFRMSWRS